MICQPCAISADAQKRASEADFGGIVTRCPGCLRFIAVYTTASQKIIWHKVKNPDGGTRVKCPGSGKHALISGHSACTGCDCAHHPVKEKS